MALAMIRRLALIALGAVLGAYVGRWFFQKGYNEGAKDTHNNYGKVLKAETSRLNRERAEAIKRGAPERPEPVETAEAEKTVLMDQYVTFDHAGDAAAEIPPRIYVTVDEVAALEDNPPIIRDQYGLNDPQHEGPRFSFNEVVAQADAIQARQATRADFDRMWPGRGDR
jgi:hypothetical protein